MKHQPQKFDAFRLAREGGVLEGTLDVSVLERLADRVAEGAVAVDWRIEGATDRAGRPALEVSLRGTVPLTCQRCLFVFGWPVEQQTTTVLARSEADADALDADSDDEVLVADHLIDPVGLIEDELLLTLPYAPMHEVGACEATGGA